MVLPHLIPPHLGPTWLPPRRKGEKEGGGEEGGTMLLFIRTNGTVISSYTNKTPQGHTPGAMSLPCPGEAEVSNLFLALRAW